MIVRKGLEAVKMGKYIALDGHPCKSEAEMEAHNKKVRRLLLPDKIKKKFGRLIIMERAEWFYFNVVKKHSETMIDFMGQRWLKPYKKGD